MSKENKHALSKVEGLIPELRFPEFKNEGEWDIEELSELGELINGLTYSPEDVSDKGLLVLRSSNIQNGMIDLNDCVYVRENIKGANLSMPSDILVCVRNGSKNLIGKKAIIPKGLPLATHGAFMTVFRASNPEFVFQLFQTDYYDIQVKADLGATINSINGKNFLKYEFTVPKNPNEQQKIASCLSSLDEVIAAHRQKLELLKDQKKGLLQNLFPTNSITNYESSITNEDDQFVIRNSQTRNLPKYRFKEFEKDGEWVEKTFEELFVIGNGRDYKHLEKGEIPVYGSGGYMLSVDEYLYDGESVCIGRKGTIDKPMFLAGKFWTVDTLFYTHSFKESLPKYIFYVFENINWRNHNEAGGVPSLSKTNIYKIEIMVPPTFKEQQKIASCLSSLDALITAQAEKIEQLKLHKKGLMQGLFPKIND